MFGTVANLVMGAKSFTGSNGIFGIRLTTGIKVTQITYKGAGPAVIGLLSNEADLLLANPGVFTAHIKAGRLRAIAAASLKRIEILPELPTLHESGFPGFEIGSWYGLAAPARTPAPIIALLHGEAVKVLREPEILARLTLDAASPVGNTPQAFAREIRDDIAKWAKVIKDANIKLTN